MTKTKLLLKVFNAMFFDNLMMTIRIDSIRPNIKLKKIISNEVPKPFNI